MGKVLVEVFFTYGKRDGRELGESYVETDSRETREEVLEYWASNSLDIEGDVEAFKDGTEDWLYIDRSGGDWDEPTGVVIELTSYSQKRDEIEREYNADLEKLNRQFNVDRSSVTNLPVRCGQIRLSRGRRDQGGGRKYLIVECGRGGFMAVTHEEDNPYKKNSEVLDKDELYDTYPINLGMAKTILDEGAI